MSTPSRFAALGAAVLMTVTAAPVVLAAPTPDDPNSLLLEAKQSTSARIGPWLAKLSEEYNDASAKGVAATDFRSAIGSLRVAQGNRRAEWKYLADTEHVGGGTKGKQRQVEQQRSKPDRRAEMGRIGRKRVAAEFSVGEMVAAYRRLYRELALVRGVEIGE